MIPRFRILQRDGFRCVYCGASPDVAELHVDHRQPRSRGGTDHPSNLVTACAACNLSKGALQPRWEACYPLFECLGGNPDDFAERVPGGWRFCITPEWGNPSERANPGPATREACLCR